MLDNDQVDRLARAIEEAVSRAGFEWLDDSYAEQCGVAPFDTPYTAGCTIIEECAGRLDEYLRAKR